MFLTLIAAIIGSIALIFLGGGFFTVNEKTAVPVMRLGKFTRFAHKGWNWLFFLIEKKGPILDLLVQEISRPVRERTNENLLINVTIVLQYAILEDNLYEAAFSLKKPDQLYSFIDDFVRFWISQRDLQKIFDEKNQLEEEGKIFLGPNFEKFGYEVKALLVTKVEPDPQYIEAMQAKATAEREREAADANRERRIIEADAKRQEDVKDAEAKAKTIELLATSEGQRTEVLAAAEARAMELRGKGTAQERHQILIGLQQSIEILRKGTPESVNDQDVMTIVLTTEYMRMLEEVGKTPGRTILLPSSPGQIGSLTSEIRNLLIGVAETSRSNESIMPGIPLS